MYRGHETLVDFRNSKDDEGQHRAVELLGQVVPHRRDSSRRCRISGKKSK